MSLDEVLNTLGDTGENFAELEVKFVAADSARHTDNFYHNIFNRIIRSTKRFPTMSSALNIRGHDQRFHQLIFRRASVGKDARVRIDFTDKSFLIPQNGIQIRMEQQKSELVIKCGPSPAAANNDDAVLSRAERKFKLTDTRIGSIGDIVCKSPKMKDIPAPLTSLFGEEAYKTKLYPGVITESQRQKFVYYRHVSFEGETYIAALEIARDKGWAKPVAGEEPYSVAQMELEVKGLIDPVTGINVLEYPETSLGANRRILSMEELRGKIAGPLLNQEAAMLCAKYQLTITKESKPQLGMERGQAAIAENAEAFCAMKAERKKLTNEASIWANIDFGEPLQL